ncbi:MAG: ligand-binding sensor domain-containing protein [Crocinitomix sp.]|jgi:ligand-binding sensor domain-containing protein
MKLNKTIFLIIWILITFSSCIGQNNLQKTKISTKPIPLGKPMRLGKLVSELDQTIWNIYQDKKSDFWFSSKENGVFHYNGEKLTHFTKEDGLVSNQIRGTQEDSIGNLFFETTVGISKFDGQSFETLKIKEPDSSVNEWKLEPNDLWFRIGFNKKGPYRYDGKYLHSLEFPKSPQEDEFYGEILHSNYSPYGIYSIYKDSKGFIWFGTTSLGVCRFDGEILSWHYEDQLQTTPSGGDFGTRAIFEDRDGHFWFNNTRYRYDILTNNTINIDYEKEKGIGYSNAYNEQEFPFFLSIEQDDDGDIWMVTYDNGVWRNNGKELIHYPIKDGEIDVLLFTIYRDNKGVLWLGTHNAGVYKFNGKSFEKFEI